jgi:hypothetical protein
MNDIESFLNMMERMLSGDLLKHIISIVCLDKNMSIIKKQKKLKYKLNKDVIKLFNTYYYDNNFLLYRNEKNQFILENISLNNKHIFVCSNKTPHAIPEELATLSSFTNDNNINEIVLFEQREQNEILYDENGLPVNRRIRLDVVYM